MQKHTALAATAGLTALVALSLGETAMAIEEPRYQLLERSEKFELRRYDPIIVAEVEVVGDFEEAGSIGFRPLADYIFGNNVPAQEIAMTAPVMQQARDGEKIAMTAPVMQQKRDGEEIAMTAPVTQEEHDGRHIVRFTMPSTYSLETLPAPRNERVKLRQLEGETYAVVRYSGLWSEGNYQRHLAMLRAELRARGLVEQGEPVWARYNSPFSVWFMRRNEIMIPVRGNGV